MPTRYSHAGFILLLAMTVALGPLALDTYLPAFPAIAAVLDVDSHALTLTLSVYVFMLSVAQLIGGPLSDRYGRQPIMLSGLLIFGGASLLITQVHSLGGIVLFRGVQALGGGWAMVCVPALVRDRVAGREAAKLFSMIGLIYVLAPALAPTIGSLLLKAGGWSSIFLFLFLYAVGLALLLKFILFRNNACVQPPLTNVNALQRYLSVLAKRPALRFICMQAMGFSVVMLFITHSSYIYQEHFKVGPQVFALLFGANIVVMTLMNLTNRVLLNYFLPRQILRFAISLQVTGIGLLISVLLLSPKLFLFVPGMMLSIGAMGAVAPNTQASFMEYFSENGGTAAALMGALQFSVGGCFSALSSLLPESVMAVVLAMGTCSLVAFMLAWIPYKTSVDQPIGA